MRVRGNGFTLIELMVTIAVLAIIAMMAAPSFGTMLNKRKLDNEVKGLAHVLSMARSQAVLLRTNTIIGLNSSLPSTQTNFFWTPQSNGIKIMNIPEGYNAPPNFIFNAQGMFIPGSFVKKRKETNAQGEEEWVADQIEIDGVKVDQLENYPREITICSEKLNLTKTLNYSIVGTFDSITEGTC